MEEQFVLRVPPSVAERIERLLNESSSSYEDKSLDLSFSEDGRNGTFVIGNDHFPASLLDLPTILESHKTYDDNVLIKTADVGQMIMVREEGDPPPDVVEHRHGLTPPMRDARRRRFRREPDLNPELVQRVEKDLLNIMNGGAAENLDILVCVCYLIRVHFDHQRTNLLLDIVCFQNALKFLVFDCFFLPYNFLNMVFSHTDMTEQDEVGDGSARKNTKKTAPAPAVKPYVSEAGTNVGEPERSDSDDSDYSV